MGPPGPRPGNSGSRRLSCTALTSSQLSGEARTAGQMTRAARNAMCGETALYGAVLLCGMWKFGAIGPSKSNDQGLLSCCLVGQPKSMDFSETITKQNHKYHHSSTDVIMLHDVTHKWRRTTVSFLLARYGPCGP